ncbi:MAG: ZIP family metal transporter [Proteobacteria bacterium]|nr:ZIP family metal transporter [Pseudomonadota bacterium]
MQFLSAIFIIPLVILHLFAGNLRFLHVIPRSRWLSFAGGAAVAYVFVHLLPELNRIQEEYREVWSGLRSEQPVFVLALAGLITFYLLERLLRRSMPGTTARDRRNVEAEQSKTMFRAHVISFAIYNAIIGYFVSSPDERDVFQQLAFVGAMAFHFLVNDYGLRMDHGDRYRHSGRWILSASLVGGWLVGMLGLVTGLVPDLLLAILAGGVILNTLKEELPAERESRASAFIAGAVAYAVLLHFV